MIHPQLNIRDLLPGRRDADAFFPFGFDRLCCLQRKKIDIPGFDPAGTQIKMNCRRDFLFFLFPVRVCQMDNICIIDPDRKAAAIVNRGMVFLKPHPPKEAEPKNNTQCDRCQKRIARTVLE